MRKKIFVVLEMMINQFIVGGAEIKNFLTFDKIYKNAKFLNLNRIIDLQKIF